MTWDKKQANKKITGKTRIVCNMIWYRIQREDVVTDRDPTDIQQKPVCRTWVVRCGCSTSDSCTSQKPSSQTHISFSSPLINISNCSVRDKFVLTQRKTYTQHMQCVTAADLIKLDLVLLNPLMFPVFCFCILCVSICSYIHNTLHFILDSNCVVNVCKCSLV